MKVLGIETSCDETGVAIYDNVHGLLANKLDSQIKLHADYGGVVPELAARDHINKIIPLILSALEESHLNIQQINAVAYTAGPGLMGALLVGATVGCSLAFALNIPSIAIHHMEAHILSIMLEKKYPEYPLIALLVSGGHTQLIQVKGIGKYILLGETLDDAVGEAFDKTAKLLGLGYPGGSILSEIARKGIPNRFIFPRPMIDRPGFNFSFSGLKTFAANIIRRYEGNQQAIADIAYAFEDAVIDTLIIKCSRALEKTGCQNLLIAGGVSANLILRQRARLLMDRKGGKVFYARSDFCTDNGAMIAYNGMIRFKSATHTLAVKVRPRWDLSELEPI